MEMNNTQMLKGLYGSQIGRTKAVGYCYMHKAALTAKTLRQHQCLCKQCNCLKKYEEHSYWKQREVIKERRKSKKEGLN